MSKIKQETSTKQERIYKEVVPEFRDVKVITYTCSDGKQFTNENDDKPRYKKGKQLAEEHEAMLAEREVYKKHLKWYSIRNDRNENHGREYEFIFYWSLGLPDDVKNFLYGEILDEFRTQKSRDEFKEGWYYVSQDITEEYNSNGPDTHHAYGMVFSPLDQHIDLKKAELATLANHAFNATMK